jgi:LuxR family maltose regulon positive regulatory protein
LARLHANQGQLHQSYEDYQQAAQWIQEIGGEHLGASSLVEVGMADVLCEWNDLASARAHVERGLASIHLWGKADDLILACLTQARIELAQSDLNAATEATQKAVQTLHTHGVFPEAPQAVQLARVKLWLLQGYIQASSSWAASLEQRFRSGDPFRYENEVTHIARAHVWIAEDKLDEAIDLLSRLDEKARVGGRMGRVIEILTLLARARWQRGDSEGALLALADCLALAEPEGYMRIFLDEGEPLFKLLEQATASGWAKQHKQYIDRLLAAPQRGTTVSA